VAKLTSQTALGSTQNQDVIAFAKGEILEQTAVASALTSLVSPPPPPLTPMQQQAIEQVKNAPTGQFDAVYLQTQISGHKTLLEIQDSLLAGYSTPTTDDVHIALIAKAFIENHLYILGQLYQRVG
jgi:predicted outer membrane protein